MQGLQSHQAPSPPVHAVNQAIAAAASPAHGTYSSAYILDSTIPGGSPTSAASGESKAMMVVCGTDGSGTRGVVQTLTKLGVVMTSEDPETYDIHGDLMGGWPPVGEARARLYAHVEL